MAGCDGTKSFTVISFSLILVCGSPYSPPYDNPSPHSIGCSTSPHGSPASIIPCSTPPHGSPFSTSPHGSPFSTPPHGSPFPMPPCTDSNQFTPYISPSPSLHDIPSASLPLTSGISHPYDNSSVIYSNVPNMSSNYFLDTAHPHWMNGNAAPNHFDTFPHSPGHMFEGEIPVAIIDQLQRGGGHVEMEMTPQLNFYPSPSGSPERHPVFFHDMPVMAPTLVPSELTASPPCPPYSAHKPAKCKTLPCGKTFISNTFFILSFSISKKEAQATCKSQWWVH